MFFCFCFFNNSIEFSNEIRDLMMMSRCFRSGVGDDIRGKSAKRKKQEVLRTELCSKSILPCNVNAIFNDCPCINRDNDTNDSSLV